MLNRWGVRKPVFNAFKLLKEAGSERWNVSGIRMAVGGAGVVLFASKDTKGTAHFIAANHENAAINVTINVANTNSNNGTITRIDDTHANAYTAWVAMGSPKASATGELGERLTAVRNFQRLSVIPLLDCVLGRPKNCRGLK